MENKDLNLGIDKNEEDIIAQQMLDTSMAETESFSKDLEKQIDRRIKRAAIKYALIIVLIVALIFFGISPIMNLSQRYFTKTATKVENADGSVNQSKLEKVLGAYYETTHPGVEINRANLEAEGFGKYKVNLSLYNHRGDAIIGETNVVMKHKWMSDELSVESDPEHVAMCMLGIFDNRYYEGVDKDKAEISQLPKSAWLSVYVMLKKPVDIITLKDEGNDDFGVDWVQVYQKNCEFQGGMNLVQTNGWGPIVREDMNEKQLKKTYLDNLTLLKNNQELWKGLPLYSGNSEYFPIDEVLDKNIKKLKSSNEFKTKRIWVNGSRDQVLKFIEKYDVTFIRVEDAKFSTLERQ